VLGWVEEGSPEMRYRGFGLMDKKVVTGWSLVKEFNEDIDISQCGNM